MMYRIFFAALATGAAFAALPAEAQDAPRGADVTRAQAQERAGQVFDRIDANGDGRLDQADREERQRARFARLDSDGDGAISREEFSAMHERRAERGSEARPQAAGRRAGMLRGLDSDGDGAISRDEFAARALALFDRADANKDGTLTAEERRAGRDALGGWRRGRAEG